MSDFNVLQAVSNIPGYIFWKNKESRLLGCNKNFAKIAGQTTKSVIGKTDFDLPWKKSEADAFRRDDNEVVETGRSMLNIEEPMHQAKNNGRFILTSKIPLR